jgi:hypothetical protein
MAPRDTDKSNFDELLGAWRRRMDAQSMDAETADRSSRRAREDGSGDGSHGGSGDWGAAFFGDLEDWLGDNGKLKAQVAEMDKQMQLMARTINMLLDRVSVLERLAVQDEKRLADEIEKLRR